MTDDEVLVPVPIAGAGDAGVGPLPWSFADQRLSVAASYWLATTSPDGRPHAVPIWGLWRNHRIYCEGRPENVWVRNLRSGSPATVHLPDPDQVVIVRGSARFLADDDLSPSEWADLDARFQQKYRITEGSPYIVIVPRYALAWDGDIATTTRWALRPVGPAPG